MPMIRRRKKGRVAEYYYAYVGDKDVENISWIEDRLRELGVRADRWVSCNGMVEYRVHARSVGFCPNLNVPEEASSCRGAHKTKGFPFISGDHEFVIYLYSEDSTSYLKDSKNPWLPIGGTTRRRRRYAK